MFVVEWGGDPDNPYIACCSRSKERCEEWVEKRLKDRVYLTWSRENYEDYYTIYTAFHANSEKRLFEVFIYEVEEI